MYIFFFRLRRCITTISFFYRANDLFDVKTFDSHAYYTKPSLIIKKTLKKIWSFIFCFLFFFVLPNSKITENEMGFSLKKKKKLNLWILCALFERPRVFRVITGNSKNYRQKLWVGSSETLINFDYPIRISCSPYRNPFTRINVLSPYPVHKEYVDKTSVIFCCYLPH